MDVLIVEPLHADVLHWLGARHAVHYAPELAADPNEFRGLLAGARAVVVPFAGGHETEQALRARCFAERGLVDLVDEGDLSPATLAAAVDRAARKPPPSPGAIDLDGAKRSAALIAQLAAGNPAMESA